MSARVSPSLQSAPSQNLPSFKKSYQIGDRYLTYKLTPNQNRTDYIAQVKLKGHSYHTVPLVWENLKASEFSTLNPHYIQITIIAKQNGSFEVKIFRNMISGALVSDGGVSGTASGQNLNFVFFNNAWDLASALGKDNKNGLLENMLKKMLSRFHKEKSPSKDDVRELLALLLVVSEEDRRSILNKFVQDINDSYLEHKTALDALKSGFKLFRLSVYKKIVDGTKPGQTDQDEVTTEDPDPLVPFSADELVRIAKLLIERIAKASGAVSQVDGKEPAHLWDLEVLIAVLEVMEMIQTKKVERKKHHEPFYDTLDSYDLDANLKFAYLAALGKQILVHIPDDETKPHAFVRHAYHFLKCCVYLYLAYETKSLDPLAEAGKSLQAALKFQESEADWYTTLYSIDFALMNTGERYLSALNYVIEWAELGQLEAIEIINKLHTHNPFFVMGLVRSLQQFIEHHANVNAEAGKSAILLLEKIGLDNLPGKEGLFTVHMGTYRTIRRLAKRDIPDIVGKGATERDSSYSHQLKEEVFTILKHYGRSHPLLSIRRAAEEAKSHIYREESSSDQKSKLNSLPPFEPEKLPTTFFEDTAKKVVPYRIGLRKEYENLCHDEQLTRDKPYYIGVQVETPTGRLEIDQAFNDFLNSSDQVMLVSGPAGAGKSFSVKYFAQETWGKGALNGYIPVFVSLPTLNDPKQAVIETLTKRGLQTYIADLQQGKHVKILWILDALDEAKRGLEDNLYRSNQLYLWENSKTILTVRSDYLDEVPMRHFYPNGVTNENFRRINLIPFDESRRKQFLTQFLQIYENKGIHVSWTANQYMEYIDTRKELQNVISVPFYLHLTAETLPQIVAARAEEGISKDDPIVRIDLLDAFFCLMVARDIESQKRSSQGLFSCKIHEYLDYAIEVAEAIDEYEVETQILDKDGKEIRKGSTWIPEDLASERYPHLFDKDNEKAKRMRRCCSVVFRDGMVGFSHEAFYAYFYANSQRKSIIKNRLVKGKYGFDKLLSNSANLGLE